MEINIEQLKTELSSHGNIILCDEIESSSRIIIVINEVMSNEETIKNIIESHISSEYTKEISTRLESGTFKCDYKK